MLNVSVTSSTKEQLEDLCSKAIDNSQDFTDSVYISIEQREKVLDYHKKLQEQLAEIITFITNNNEIGFTIKSDVLPLAIQTIQHIGHDFRKDVSHGYFFFLTSSHVLVFSVGTNSYASCVRIFPHT